MATAREPKGAPELRPPKAARIPWIKPTGRAVSYNNHPRPIPVAQEGPRDDRGRLDTRQAGRWVVWCTYMAGPRPRWLGPDRGPAAKSGLMWPPGRWRLEMARRGRWSALGGAWPDPKGPGRCLPTPWVPWVRAVPIGPLRWPGGRSRGPESAVLRSGAVVGTHPVRPCTCTMRPTQVPELPVAGPHAPKGCRSSGLGAVALV